MIALKRWVVEDIHSAADRALSERVVRRVYGAKGGTVEAGRVGPSWLERLCTDRSGAEMDSARNRKRFGSRWDLLVLPNQAGRWSGPSRRPPHVTSALPYAALARVSLRFHSRNVIHFTRPSFPLFLSSLRCPSRRVRSTHPMVWHYIMMLVMVFEERANRDPVNFACPSSIQTRSPTCTRILI
jgi:hypothetical protein